MPQPQTAYEKSAGSTIKTPSLSVFCLTGKKGLQRNHISIVIAAYVLLSLLGVFVFVALKFFSAFSVLAEVAALISLVPMSFYAGYYISGKYTYYLLRKKIAYARAMSELILDTGMYMKSEVQTEMTEAKKLIKRHIMQELGVRAQELEALGQELEALGQRLEASAHDAERMPLKIIFDSILFASHHSDK